MPTMAGPRKTISIYDYPEHLNPFRDDENHHRIRFWTIGKKLNRSNSINFSGIKDLKNSWAFRSFMRKGKKQNSSQNLEQPSQTNGEHSPVVFRRSVQYSTMSRATVGSPERADRYVYGGSVTPLPRSRFQERLRSPSQNEVSLTPRMARSDVTGSRLSVESANPFDDQPPVPPVRMSRRKKKKAPMPPQNTSANDTSMTISETSEVNTTISNASEVNTTISETSQANTTIGINETFPSTISDTTEVDAANLSVELRIVEDEDLNKNKLKTNEEDQNKNEYENNNNKDEIKEPIEDTVKPAGSEENILTKASFPKIDIAKYRRNSSVNEDEIRLRRGNLEDFHILSTKRSKSLNNAYESSFVTYDINLNAQNTVKDANGNEEPHKVICKVYDEPVRKQSIDNSISSTEREFIEIDKATRELEREISKLNSALHEDDICSGVKVSEIKRRFDNGDIVTPNPIPKPRRSHYGEKIDV